MSNHRRPLVVATTVLVLGVAASLAGNLQAINLDNASPGVGAYVSATAWPLLLFGVVELLIHTPWLANWRDRVTKGAVLVAVASVAAWVSYWHLANVLSHYGYDQASRYAGPVAIDAAMVLAALALDRVVQARRVDKDNAVDNGQADKPWTTPDPDRPLLSTDVTVADVQAEWTGHVDTALANAEDKDTQELSNVQAEVDKAIGQTGQELANETEDWLASLSTRIEDRTHTPPVQVSKPLPQRVSKRVDIPEDEATELAKAGVDSGLKAGEIAELLAGYYGVSARTIRRQPWWLETMAD